MMPAVDISAHKYCLRVTKSEFDTQATTVRLEKLMTIAFEAKGKLSHECFVPRTPNATPTSNVKLSKSAKFNGYLRIIPLQHKFRHAKAINTAAVKYKIQWRLAIQCIKPMRTQAAGIAIVHNNCTDKAKYILLTKRVRISVVMSIIKRLAGFIGCASGSILKR
jgi:hypothetical protein